MNGATFGDLMFAGFPSNISKMSKFWGHWVAVTRLDKVLFARWEDAAGDIGMSVERLIKSRLKKEIRENSYFRLEKILYETKTIGGYIHLVMEKKSQLGALMNFIGKCMTLVQKGPKIRPLMVCSEIGALSQAKLYCNICYSVELQM